MNKSLKFTKALVAICTVPILVAENVSPVAAQLSKFNLGNALADGAKRLGASEKFAGYIRDSLDPDPRNGGRILVRSASDAGIIGDAESCAAFSDLSSTAGSLVVGYFTGGTAAGYSKGLGKAVTDKACAEKYGAPGSQADVEAAKQTIRGSMPTLSPQEQAIIMAQVKAGERIAELQTKAKIEEAKILAQSALDVERTKQNGETERARIQANKLIEMTKLNNAKDIELAYIDLQKVQVTQQAMTDREKLRSDADVKIQELKTNGQIREAELLAETLIRAKQAEAEAQKAVSQDAKDAAIRVAEIQYDALLKMTQSTNSTEIDKARIEAETRRRELRTQTTGTTIEAVTKLVMAFLDRDVKRREIDAQIRQSELAVAAKSGVLPSTTADQLLAEWGWSKVACYPNAVFIQLGSDTVCVNPNAAVLAGQYRYDRASNQLIPLAPPSASTAPSLPPTPSSTMPVQTTGSPDPGGF